MTLQEEITKVDTLKPNPYSNEEKVSWLNVVEGMLIDKVFRKSEKYKDMVFTPYIYETDANKDLLVPSPYNDIYLKYMFAQIDYLNGEYTNYNNSAAMYNSSYDDFSTYFREKNIPKTGTQITL